MSECGIQFLPHNQARTKLEVALSELNPHAHMELYVGARVDLAHTLAQTGNKERKRERVCVYVGARVDLTHKRVTKRERVCVCMCKSGFGTHAHIGALSTHRR